MSPNHEHSAGHAATCLGEFRMPCVAYGPGHEMHPVQRAVATATPSSWIDMTVDEAGQGGWMTLCPLGDGREARVWRHASITGAGVGQPVALHATYHVLAVGGRWFNVLVGD